MSDIAIRLKNVGKFYKLYDSNRDRLREAFDFRRRKRHREFYALRGINLEVQKGEILGIVGRNGAGKSTLLKILSGVIPVNSGQVEVNGRVSAMLELGSGLNPNLDGIQNIYFGGIMMGFSREEMKKRLDEIVAFAAIGDFIKQPMRTYSSGMRARLGFALAVNVSPDILIIDEVLSVGDELFRRKCYAKMEELFRLNCTVLYVTHNANTINELCSRAIFLDQGEVILDGLPKFVTLNYEKYLFGNPDYRKALREELLSTNPEKRKETSPRRFDDVPTRGNFALDDFCETANIQKTGKDDACIHEAVYLDEFISRSKIVFQTEKIDLFDVHITTEDGRRVNYLYPSEMYVLKYSVKFSVDAENIALSCLFKTEKGLALSGVKYPGIRKTLDEIKKNTTYSIKMKFKCGFLPGNYYVDLGVISLASGKKRILSAEYDSLVFKVQQCKCMREKVSCWAYFSVEPELEIVHEPTI